MKNTSSQEYSVEDIHGSGSKFANLNPQGR